MKLSRKVGATSQILQIFVRDSSSTIGAGLTGLTSGSSGLTAYYHRDTDTTATAISLTSMTVGTFTSSGFAEIDATNMPGHYQLCPPNTALASGATSIMLHLKGATNMAPLPIEIDLDTQVDVYLWNGTAVSAPATAGIPDVNVKNVGNQTATAAAGVTFPSSIASPTNITGGTITTATNLTNAAILTPAYDFAKGTVAMVESYAAKNAALTPIQALYGMNQQLGEQGIAGTTMTVKKRDQSTTAKVFGLDSATTPTTITEVS